MWGAFNFAQKNLTDAGYNASIADPFRGMPYYVADQHLSKWRNQYYDLKFRAATPLLGNHWALGLEGNYVPSPCSRCPGTRPPDNGTARQSMAHTAS